MKKNVLLVMCVVVITIISVLGTSEVRHFKSLYELTDGLLKLEQRELEALKEGYSVLQQSSSSDIRRWQSAASDVLMSRGYPIKEPTPNDLRRLRLKTVANMAPVITNGLLTFKVKGLELADAMKFTRDSTNNSFMNEHLFLNPNIVSITLRNGKMDIEPLQGVAPDDILPFVSAVLDAEKGDEPPLDLEQ